MPIKTIKRIRGNLARGVLAMTDMCAIGLGMLPFSYDANATCVHRHERTALAVVFYAIILYALLLATFICTVWLFTATGSVALFDQKPMSGVMSTVHGVCSLLTMLVVLLRNWFGRREYLQIVADMNALRLRYFQQRLPALEACGTFDTFVLLGASIRLMQNVSTVWALVGIGQRWMFILIACLLIPLTNIIYTMQHQFCFGVLHIFRFSWALNRQLEALATNRNSTRGSDKRTREIAAIGVVSVRLADLCERLMHSLDWQVLLIIYLFITANAEHMFNFANAWSGKIHAYDFFVFMQIVLINFVDVWFMFTACELALDEAGATLLLLGKFNDYPDFDVRLLRNVEALALVRSYRRARFSVCGLFDLHYQTGCDVVLTSVLYMVVLLQYDFKSV